MENLKEAEMAALKLIGDIFWSHDPESGLEPMKFDSEYRKRCKEVNEALIKFKTDEKTN